MFWFKKTPENPELSFQLKRQLESLNKNEESEEEFESDMILEDWQAKYKKMLGTFEKRRMQIIQDEYLAKVIQNEEFLNELRLNKDFIQTLRAGEFLSVNFIHHVQY
jgi:hypothetical protein